LHRLVGDGLGEGVVPAPGVGVRPHPVERLDRAVRRGDAPEVVDGAEAADAGGEGADEPPAVTLEHGRHLCHRRCEEPVLAADELDRHVQVHRGVIGHALVPI